MAIVGYIMEIDLDYVDEGQSTSGRVVFHVSCAYNQDLLHFKDALLYLEKVCSPSNLKCCLCSKSLLENGQKYKFEREKKNATNRGWKDNSFDTS
jgi:hypothetical protein